MGIQLRPPASAAAAAATVVLLVTAACGEPPAGVASPRVASAQLGAHNRGIYGMVQAPISGPGCDAPEYRQFDFWVGHWEVGPGAPLTPSIIRSELGGCVVEENWGGGPFGRSLNMYDFSTGLWYQHWIAPFGGPASVMHFAGGIDENGDMVMEGTRAFRASHPFFPGLSNATLTDVGVWTPITADSVRQQFFLSINGGPLAQTFDGRYGRRASVTPLPDPGAVTCRNRARNHEMDFTLGSWDVHIEAHRAFDPDKKLTRLGPAEGTSEIATDLGYCLVEERFRGKAGYEAHVFTSFNPIAVAWERTHTDSYGIRVFLQNGQRLADGSVVMTGKRPSAEGALDDLRVTWAPVPDADAFTQTWETSVDGGATWTVDFTAIYVRRGS